MDLSECDSEPQLHGDILLATDEALSNCADHAYRDTRAAEVGHTMALRASHDPDTKTVTVCISDRGVWAEPLVTPESRVRGRGLPLMRALADKFTCTGPTQCTSVCLQFHLSGHAPIWCQQRVSEP